MVNFSATVKDINDDIIQNGAICTLRLMNPKTGTVLHKNPNPGGACEVRPWLLGAQQDTGKFIVESYKQHKKEINELKSTVYKVNGKVVTITHQVINSMYDGKATL